MKVRNSFASPCTSPQKRAPDGPGFPDCPSGALPEASDAPGYPVVHQRPHSQTKMQARFAFAEAFLMFVPISIPVGAPHVQALSASSLCNSDDAFQDAY